MSMCMHTSTHDVGSEMDEDSHTAAESVHGGPLGRTSTCFSAPTSQFNSAASTRPATRPIAGARQGCGVPTDPSPRPRSGSAHSVEPDDYGGDIVLHGAVAPPPLARDLCDPVGGGLWRLGVGRDGDRLR